MAQQGKGIALPQRSTRGKRMRAALEDEEAEADTSFWNQDFFQEEAVDGDYEEEHEEEDVPDSDFDEPEDDADDDEGVEDAEERPKRKALKAPEPKGPPRQRAAKATPAKAAAKAKVSDEEDLNDGEDQDYGVEEEEEEEEEEDEEGEGAGPSQRGGSGSGSGGAAARKKANARKAQQAAALAASYAAPSLRASTKQKSADAQQERMWRSELVVARPRARNSGSGPKPLTQAELLAEATRTEYENSISLKALLAMEHKHTLCCQLQLHACLNSILSAAGRFAACMARSACMGVVQGVGGSDDALIHNLVVVADVDPVLYEICNMHYPPVWLRCFRAQPPAPPPLCAVSGLPAKYRDPQGSHPYRDIPTFRQLRGLPPLPPGLPTPCPTPAAPPGLPGSGPAGQAAGAGQGHGSSSVSGVQGLGSAGGGTTAARATNPQPWLRVGTCCLRTPLTSASPSPAAAAALASLPPPCLDLAEPSLMFPLVGGHDLPCDVAALLVDLHQGKQAAPAAATAAAALAGPAQFLTPQQQQSQQPAYMSRSI
ncbi:YL1 nuclear protein-domain-containing protein, partial [Haematococcus lacustris]